MKASNYLQPTQGGKGRFPTAAPVESLRATEGDEPLDSSPSVRSYRVAEPQWQRCCQPRSYFFAIAKTYGICTSWRTATPFSFPGRNRSVGIASRIANSNGP